MRIVLGLYSHEIGDLGQYYTMDSIKLSERTFAKFREIKAQIIAEDASACKGEKKTMNGDCISDIVFFWNDDRLVEFMIDIVKHQVGGAGYSSYVLAGKEHGLTQEERKSLL